jgi:hypothetical protein
VVVTDDHLKIYHLKIYVDATRPAFGVVSGRSLTSVEALPVVQAVQNSITTEIFDNRDEPSSAVQSRPTERLGWSRWGTL